MKEKKECWRKHAYVGRKFSDTQLVYGAEAGTSLNIRVSQNVYIGMQFDDLPTGFYWD